MLHLPMTLKQRYPKSLVNHTYHKRNPLLIQENPPAFKNLPQNSIWLSLEGERDRQYSDNIANAITYPKIQQDSAWRGKEIGNILWHLPLHRIFILSIYIIDPTLLMSTTDSRNTVLGYIIFALVHVSFSQLVFIFVFMAHWSYFVNDNDWPIVLSSKYREAHHLPENYPPCRP